jgi:hypothetical protein
LFRDISSLIICYNIGVQFFQQKGLKFKSVVKEKMKTKHKNQEEWTKKEKNLNKKWRRKNICRTYVCPIFFSHKLLEIFILHYTNHNNNVSVIINLCILIWFQIVCSLIGFQIVVNHNFDRPFAKLWVASTWEI